MHEELLARRVAGTGLVLREASETGESTVTVTKIASAIVRARVQVLFEVNVRSKLLATHGAHPHLVVVVVIFVVVDDLLARLFVPPRGYLAHLPRILP